MRISFGLELQIDKSGDETVDKVRNNAFLFARQILIQGKAVSYAEQFQGMYALTRGLVSVLALGCLYWVGWASTAAQCRLPNRDSTNFTGDLVVRTNGHFGRVVMDLNADKT